MGATRGGSKFRQPLAKHAPNKLETKKASTNKDSFPNLFDKEFQVNAFALQPTLVCVSPKQFPVPVVPHKAVAEVSKLGNL